MHGYAEAKEIDATIERLMEEDPITKDNARNWLTFAATLQGTCMMIKKQAKDRMQ